MKNLSLEPSRARVVARRAWFAGLVLATLALITWQATAMLQVNGWTPLKAAILALLVTLMAPVVLSFWTAAIGFMVQWSGGDDLDLTRTLGETRDFTRSRTAIVMPIYDEDPVRVFAGLKATYGSLEATGWLPDFDFFVLSDTRDPDIWVREELAFAAWRKEASDPSRLFYRNRRENVERKSGNIADFCAAWGDRYTYMIVLDADSIMTGRSLVNLVRLMDRHPGVGIIQAPPLPVNRRTLFGRLHQFATEAYSRIFITGLNFWQGGAANYWGHNAIIRIQPFVEHCRLPTLSGKQPLGGPILSHDFVEAAFMRRAGWKVYLASELRGSYEELPASLIDYAARDRRWCQGNLQHLRLLAEPGLHFVNRVHLWMGAMSYLASPLWLLMMGLTTCEGILEEAHSHRSGTPGSLLTALQASAERRALWLFVLMMGLLLAPKLLSLALCLRRPDRRRDFGGARRLAASVFFETLGSALLAPILALLQARFVFSILMGGNAKWEAQQRGETQTTMATAVRRFWFGTLLGLGWTALLLATVPELSWWFVPVLAGFIMAIPLSAWSSRPRLGEWARQRGLFCTPEEIYPPKVLQRFQQQLAAAQGRSWALPGDGLGRVLADPETCDIHLALLPPSDLNGAPQPARLRELQEKLHLGGLQSLDAREKRELLLDPESIQTLAPDFTRGWGADIQRAA
jgi:membrane glycosyltransferase